MTLNFFRINYCFVTYSGKISGHPGDRARHHSQICSGSGRPQRPSLAGSLGLIGSIEIAGMRLRDNLSIGRDSRIGLL